MAITISNREELQRLALAKGASITYPDGKKFNASRAVAKPTPKPAPQAEAKPAPSPQASDKLLDAVLEQNALLASEQQRISAMVVQALALASTQSPPEPVKPHEWVFTVERDKRDRLTKIIARPA